MNIIIPDVNLLLISPHLAVIVAAVLALCWQLTFKPKSNAVPISISVAGLLVGLVATGTIWNNYYDQTTFNGSVLADRFGMMFNFIIISGALLVLLMAEPYLKEKRANFTEAYPLILFSAAGAMFMASSLDLMIIFIGIEIMSLSLYVLAGLARSEDRSEEAAIKYFLLGAFASAFLLYGIALSYGAAGTTRLDLINIAMGDLPSESHSLLIAGLGLLLVGLGFKASLVPFHQWTPDVYHGAPTSVTAFMASVVKVSAFAVLLRLLGALNELNYIWQPILFGLSLLTMTAGNLAALVQSNAKRLLAYSSISHAGYLLVGIIAGTTLGTSAVIYYAIAYTAVTVGAFAVLSLAVKDGREAIEISDLNGLWNRKPLAAVLMILFMASLAGIPPTAGFFGKFGLFQAALESANSHTGTIGYSGFLTLALAIAVNSAISLYYYMKLVAAMFISESSKDEMPLARSSFSIQTVAFLCAFVALAAGLAYSWVNQAVTPSAFYSPSSSSFTTGTLP